MTGQPNVRSSTKPRYNPAASPGIIIDFFEARCRLLMEANAAEPEEKPCDLYEATINQKQSPGWLDLVGQALIRSSSVVKLARLMLAYLDLRLSFQDALRAAAADIAIAD